MLCRVRWLQYSTTVTTDSAVSMCALYMKSWGELNIMHRIGVGILCVNQWYRNTFYFGGANL